MRERESTILEEFFKSILKVSNRSEKVGKGSRKFQK